MVSLKLHSKIPTSRNLVLTDEILLLNVSKTSWENFPSRGKLKILYVIHCTSQAVVRLGPNS